jgi:sedoheptulokinase
MIGSGNGLRKNPHLCRIFEETFDLPLVLSENEEEAACGAAIYAASHCK